MSNLELARFLCVQMWRIAFAAAFLARGNGALSEKYEEEFKKALTEIDRLDSVKPHIEEP